MKYKYITGAVSFITAVFLFAFSFISINPAQTAFAQTVTTPVATPVTCPAGYTCTVPVPIPQAPCYLFSTNLTVGTASTEVAALQTFLVSKGFLVLPTRPTGYFGEETKVALMAFQTSVNLPATGSSGPLTIAALNAACGGGSTPTPTTPIPTTDATAAISGTPTLALSYERMGKESSLVATFNVSVNGGTKGVNLYKGAGGANVRFYNEKGIPYNLSTQSTVISASVQVASTVDNNGLPIFIVPAGKTYTFKIVSTVNPQQMFAGAYYASLDGGLYGVVGVNKNDGVKIPLTDKFPNKVTIVGEVAPLVTSVTSPAIAGKSFTIMGQRLYGTGGAKGRTALLIDGKTFSPTSFSKDGTSVTITLPSYFVVGSTHTASVRSTLNGTSNVVSFQIASPTTPSSDATVVMNGAQALALTYDSTQKESALTATFNFTVTAGNSDLYLSTAMANAALLDQNGSYAPANSIQVNVGAGEKSDYYGRNYTILSPGKSVQMSVILGANPGQLFAGTYTASLVNLYSYNGNPMDPNVSFGSIIPLKNQTNSKTIVGELSPYISSMTNPAVQGQTVTIAGQRLANSTVRIDGASVNLSTTAATNGTSLSFTLPTTVSVGDHYLALNDSTTGLSNQVSFTAFAASTTPATKPSVTITSPVDGITVPVGNVSFTGTATGGSGSYKYTWKFGTNGDSTVSNNFEGGSNLSGYYFNYPGKFPVTLSVTDSLGSVSEVKSIYVNVVSGAAQVSNLSWSIAPLPGTAQGPGNTTTFSGAFTITAGNAPVYISTKAIAALTLVTSEKNVDAVITAFAPANGIQSYDNNGVYQITPGSSRQFNVNGKMTNNRSETLTVGAGINAINLSSSPTLSSLTPILTGLQGLNSDFHMQILLGGNGTGIGSVSASIDSSSPMSSTMPAGAFSATFAVIDLKAIGSSVSTLNGIQIASDSANGGTTFRNIRVYQGSTLVGTVGSLVSNGSYYYQWINLSGVALPANTNIPLRFVADIAPTAPGGTVRLGIAGLNFASPGATVSGLPIYGANMTIITPGSSAAYNSKSAPVAKTANVWDALTNWISAVFSN